MLTKSAMVLPQWVDTEAADPAVHCWEMGDSQHWQQLALATQRETHTLGGD